MAEFSGSAVWCHNNNNYYCLHCSSLKQPTYKSLCMLLAIRSLPHVLSLGESRGGGQGPGGGVWGWGTLIFFSYVGSCPASTVQPQKISGISSTPKKYLKFWQPLKQYLLFCTLTLIKDTKMHRNDH